MTALTVDAPASTESKSISIVQIAGGSGVSLTQTLVVDAEHPLAADERPAQVEAERLGVLAAEHGDRAVGQHDLEGDDVGVGDALGQAVRTARVVGDVAADRARLLAARVGREVQPVDGDGPGQVEVEHAGLDPRPAARPGRR